MDVSIRDLRNHTGRVVAAVDAGERVVLTVHGRPVADIVPHESRSLRRPAATLLAELSRTPTDAQLAGDIAAAMDATTDDVAAGR
jgi:prevent-host-death family protein